jgi:osmotically-inducible protein OsmY
MKSDLQIQQDIIAELKWEPVLNANEIGVSVKDGVVTLSGILDTYGKKIAAEKAAKRVMGVRAVAMDIQVGISPVFKKTDSEIAEMILTALRMHTAIQEDQIRIKVEDGNVTLEGSVEWEYQRKAALNAVENLPGVRNVLNLIFLRPETPLTNDIERKIRSAFHRRATLDAENIFVEVSGSKVSLKGSVSSMKEKDDAEEAAWAAPGVTQVNNRLLVEEMALVL